MPLLPPPQLRRVRLLALATCGLLLHAPFALAVDDQLTTLGAPTNGPRFTLTEITWPENPGEAEVCLWKDDKYAAASITIDDNCAPDHQWWLDICEQHDIRVTWFVVTGGVGGSNTAFNGTWDGFQALRDAGHSVQSHTVNHRSTGDTDSDEINRAQYADSKATIEANMPGNECLTLAYPYGRGNQSLAAEQYIAARGTNGQPSKANSVNYLNTNKGGISESYINSVLGRPASTSWLNDARYKRGWLQPLYHFLQDRDEAAADIARLVAERDLIWIDTYVDVVKYAQERDSATLTTVASEPKRIELSLVDLMRDDIFDYPLTIKVRLPDDWNELIAQQNDAPIDADYIVHDGHPYALVHAVPNRGAIELKKRTAFLSWAAQHNFAIGVNDSLADDPNTDGRSNLEHFAFDTDPFGREPSSDKQRLEFKAEPATPETYLSLTLPVRTGAVFSGNPPSATVDGITYRVFADRDLATPKGDLAIEEVFPAEASGLPELSDSSGDALPDWEYHTFRVTSPLNELDQAFLWIEVQAEEP